MKPVKKGLLLAILCLLFSNILAQQKLPATVSVVVTPPYTVFLSDYISSTSNKLVVSILFNDFNEPLWDVYLKLKLESTSLRIKTKSDFKPTAPITVLPGIPLQISGDKLYTYFDANNIDIDGMSREELIKNGRLIEGNYSFSFEVYDYKSGKLLSNTASIIIQAKLNDPPVIVNPVNNAVIAGQPEQNINFQWQLPDANPTAYQFVLSLYELPNYTVDPANAVSSNQAVKIFESSRLDYTNLLYDKNYPLLEKGKKYAWRVQVVGTSTREEFKNSGFSKVNTFYFGYREGGKIQISAPANEYAFSLRDTRLFRWKAPDNLATGQEYFYNVKIAEINENQDDSIALKNNSPLENITTTTTAQTYGYDHVVSEYLKSEQKYAWQVTAFSKDQKIASSSVNSFYGPPLLEAFYAGNHVVTVTKTHSKGLDDVTGEGEVTISAHKEKHKVYFEHIKIERLGVLLVMTKGKVSAKSSLADIPLVAEYTPNGKAIFDSDSLMIDQNGLKLKGIVKWNFPLTTIKPSKPQITTQSTWVGYNEFEFVGKAYTDSLTFELADPYGFSLILSKSSEIYLRGHNNFYPQLKGIVKLPKIKDTNSRNLELPFEKQDRVDYFKTLNQPSTQLIKLVPNTQIYFQPVSFVFDFSDDASPEKHEQDKDWKGVYFLKSNLLLKDAPDDYKQVYLGTAQTKTVLAGATEPDTCWATTTGLDLTYNRKEAVNDSALFNKFPSAINGYYLSFSKNTFNKGYWKGSLRIPFISEKTNFSFTLPLCNQGFREGYLDKTLEGYAFTFNADQEQQKVNVKINRAVFADKERLDLNINITWPYLNLTLTSIEGLKVWGNTDVGIRAPNGILSLTTQASGTIGKFPILVETIGVGKQPGLYAIGATGSVVMSDDVAGPEGPPKLNFYSISKNSLIGIYTSTSNLNGATTGIATSSSGATASSFATENTNFDDLSAQIEQKIADATAAIAASNALMASLKTDDETAVTDSSSTNNLDSIAAFSGYKLTPEELSELKAKVNIATSRLLKPVTSKIDAYMKRAFNSIDSVKIDVTSGLNKLVKQLVDSIAVTVKNQFNNETASHVIDDLAYIVSESVSTTITNQINDLVDNGIKTSINPSKILNNMVSEVFTQTLATVIERGFDDGLDIQTLADDAAKTFLEKGANVGALSKDIWNKSVKKFKDINAKDIYNEIFDNIASNAADMFLQEGVEQVSDFISEQANSVLGIFTQPISFDFDHIGDKLASAAVSQAGIVLDSIPVNMNTSVLALNGYIGFSPNDAIYGDVWRGDIDATFKVPEKFSFNVAYLIGKKDELDYWYCQARPASSKKADKSEGLTADRKAYPLKDPVKLGPVELVGISGRLYHHMKDDGKTVVPDASVNYGAYLNVVLYDTQQEGKTLYLNVAMEYVATPDGEFVFDFLGKAMVRATTPTFEGKDCPAVGIGQVHFNYNSSKHHLIGSGSLVIEKPGSLCLQGSFALDVQPGSWYISIGSREMPIVVTPSCVGYGIAGWLAVDQSTAELGIGLQYSLNAKANFDIGIVALGVSIDAGVRIGLMVKVQYSPDFAVMDAGLWADIWAKVMVDYKIDVLFLHKSGSFTLIDLYASANLTMHFSPAPKTIAGDVKGYIEFCGVVSCNFKASFSKEV